MYVYIYTYTYQYDLFNPLISLCGFGDPHLPGFGHFGGYGSCSGGLGSCLAGHKLVIGMVYCFFSISFV